MLNVRIIFGNINGCDVVVEGVIIIEDVGKIIVSIDEISFDFLLGYRKLGKVIISILIKRGNKFFICCLIINIKSIELVYICVIFIY